jgi:K+-sensing histidine kinase KdpD
MIAFRGLTPTATNFRRCAAAGYNVNMPRTFSLARLMIVITLVCVVCAVAAHYGKDFDDYLIVSLLFVPTGVVCLAVASFAHNRIIVLAFSIIGAFLSSFFLPAVQGSHHLMSNNTWTLIEPLFGPLAVIPPLGALIFGVAALADEMLQRRRHPKTQ